MEKFLDQFDETSDLILRVVKERTCYLNVLFNVISKNKDIDPSSQTWMKWPMRLRFLSVRFKNK